MTDSRAENLCDPRETPRLGVETMSGNANR